jgi:sodium pump decarboxylase gamma subunit
VILNGLTITVVGMAIVFAFLIVLVLAMNLLHAFLKRFLPKSLETKPEAASTQDTSLEPPPAPSDDLATIAAVIAATNAHILTHYRG